jgi:RNA polymerase sigma factor (sigma-70 family)
MTATSCLEDLARKAIAGDRDSVEALVRSLHGDVYKLSLRMLWNPDDAQEATQEILVRVVTRLATFDFLSRVQTWVFRVAVNYLLDVRKSAVERMNLSFERMADDLHDGLADDTFPSTEQSVLIEEVKIGCTLAMLQCLDRPHRLAYIFGEVLDLPGSESAAALGVAPAVLRKRLERARAQILTFTKSYCGLVSDAAACRCNRRVPAAVRLGRVNPAMPVFATHSASFEQLRTAIRQLDHARTILELHRSSDPRALPGQLTGLILKALDAKSVPNLK